MEAKVDELISSKPIMIFSKSRCPYCVKVKELLFDTLQVPKDKVNVIELDLEEKGSEIHSALIEKTGARTVPQVFIKGTRIGGCDDTMAAYKAGTLKDQLAEI